MSNVTRTSGQVMAAAEERSVRSALHGAMVEFYEGHDLSTAQSIRRAPTDTDAAAMVTAMRQGRLLEVLMVGGSAALGVLMGILAQWAVGNPAVMGVAATGPLGVAPAVAGMAMPLSFPVRSMLAAGGLSFVAGAQAYRMIAAPKIAEEDA